MQGRKNSGVNINIPIFLQMTYIYCHCKFQHDLQEVAKLCMKRMKQVTEHTGQEDIFKQLLSEDLAETTSETEDLPET